LHLSDCLPWFLDAFAALFKMFLCECMCNPIDCTGFESSKQCLFGFHIFLFLSCVCGWLWNELWCWGTK
jgi:hypothetical protein